jgi:RNA polymerase sigma factor (sigma-70 family)
MKSINSKSVKISKDTSESLKLYYQEIRNIKLISKKDEMDLFFEYQKTKCPKIKKLLINNNLRFVLNISKYYHNGYFYELNDIINTGTIGLIRAVEDFDPHKGFQFSTYAVWWIKQSILEGIGKESKMIKQPIKSHTVNQKFIKARNKFYNQYGFEPSIDDIREDIGENTASEILAKSINAIDDNNIISINTSLNSDEGLNYGDLLLSTIMDDNFIYSLSDLNNINFRKLNKIEKLVIYYTYGFDEKPELNFKQIANLINIKEKEIKKIHDKALKIIGNDL